MRLNYLASYDRSFKKLTSPQQENTIKAVDALIEFIKRGKKPQGLGLKKVGDHNEAKKFLKGKN